MSQKLHKTWRGEAFVESLTQFIDSGRLARGKAYRTDHRILKFEISDGRVTATVRGNKNPYFGVYKEPKYKVSLNFKQIQQQAWTKIIANICNNPAWLAKLMLNEIPDNLGQAFGEFSLLPKRFSDINSNCSCPDHTNPCKHMAGVYYRIANILDGNPMLLFPLHGLSITQLQQKLRETDLGAAFAEHLAKPEEIKLTKASHRYAVVKRLKKMNQHSLTPLRYWEMQPIKPHNDELYEPIAASLIKKQGDYPKFWVKQGSFTYAMEGIYTYIRTKNHRILS